ncbi:MAG: hypothetical protein L3J26_13795 [Candidatus Polarisedimenticolaceae bacterium]|nr:hypothetical protein [Candidatus Polarisedimenticolaceae bacterium]
MKKIITLTLAGALFMPQLFLHADESHHPKEQGMKGEPMMCKQMQEMMSQMEEIRKTDDPVERDRLVQTHMQTMQAMHEGMAMHQDSKKMACADQEAQHKQTKNLQQHIHSKTK